jgi:hypothetical protein
MATLSSLNYIFNDIDDELLISLAELANERGTFIGEELNKAIKSHLHAAAAPKKAKAAKAKAGASK